MLILILAIFSFSQGICNDLAWNSPLTISSSGVNALDPQVVMDTSGNITAAWVEGAVIKSSTMPSGGSWGALTTLSGSTASSPLLGIDSSGNVIAVWVENGVISSATMPVGGSWSAETSVSSLTGGVASTPSLAVDNNGDAIAVWARNSLIETATKLSGGSWGSVSMLTSSNVSGNPQVAISNGTGHEVIVAWHSVINSADQIQAVISTVGGSWGTTNNLVLTTGNNQNYPKVAIDINGNAAVLWFQSNGATPVFINDLVVASFLLSGATTWTTPFTVSNPGMRDPSTLSLKTAYDASGNLIAVWTRSIDGSNFNIESASLQVGQPFAGSVIINGENPYAFQADLAINSIGSALVPFIFFDGTNADIDVAETDFGGFIANAFSPQQTISTGTDNGFPKGATALSGNTINAAVVWLYFDGSNTRVNAATGSKTVIMPPTNLSVSQTPTNYGVYTDYVNTVSWTASTDPNLQGYVIYRNGVLYTQVPVPNTSVVDHNQPQTGTGSPTVYGVAAFDFEYDQSATQTVIIP